MSGGMRAIAAWAVAVFFALPAWAADNLISLLQIGGTRDSINAITTDSNGNIIIAGSTSSFNLPVTNSSTNRGTPLSVSNDFGKTWGPLSPVAVSNLVLDASTPPILYGLGRSDPNVELNLVMKSTDGGKTWAQTGSFSELSALATDPAQPGVLYAGDASGISKAPMAARPGRPIF